MFRINQLSQQIELTRGDVANIRLGATNKDGTAHTFNSNDVVRFKVFKRKDCNTVLLIKDVVVETEGNTVDISLTGEDTKIGEIINRPTKFWYEIELNPDTNPQTIIGYEVTESGEGQEKILLLLPEGGNGHDRRS